MPEDQDVFTIPEIPEAPVQQAAAAQMPIRTAMVATWARETLAAMPPEMRAHIQVGAVRVIVRQACHGVGVEVVPLTGDHAQALPGGVYYPSKLCLQEAAGLLIGAAEVMVDDDVEGL